MVIIFRSRYFMFHCLLCKIIWRKNLWFILQMLLKRVKPIKLLKIMASLVYYICNCFSSLFCIFRNNCWWCYDFRNKKFDVHNDFIYGLIHSWYYCWRNKMVRYYRYKSYSWFTSSWFKSNTSKQNCFQIWWNSCIRNTI